jgi:hypothetical protein
MNCVYMAQMGILRISDYLGVCTVLKDTIHLRSPHKHPYYM